MGKRSSLPPGFRFHPTDVELVKYYLKRKVLGKKLHFHAIAEVEIIKYAPWDLPDKSLLRTGDLKWYFFCPVEKKYANGGRLKRATDIGYWKTTGKDRSVLYKNEVVGMIKTLIFHTGRAPKGDRTDWVMYEYRLEEKELADKGIAQDGYVLCVIFKKEGPGPKNGAQYGAPFHEEEWDDDDEETEEEMNVQQAILPAAMQAPAFTISHVPESTCTGPPISVPSPTLPTVGMTVPVVSNDVASTKAPLVGNVNGGETDSSAGMPSPAFLQPCNPNGSIYASSSSYVPENMSEPGCIPSMDAPQVEAPQIVGDGNDILSLLDFFDKDSTECLTFGGIAEPETDIYQSLGDLATPEGGNNIPILQYFMDPMLPGSNVDYPMLPGSNVDYLELSDLDTPLWS